MFRDRGRSGNKIKECHSYNMLYVNKLLDTRYCVNFLLFIGKSYGVAVCRHSAMVVGHYSHLSFLARAVGVPVGRCLGG